MGTRLSPSRYRCDVNARDDEPIFTLLGRDPTAGEVVRYWIVLREYLGKTEGDQLREATLIATSMDAYADNLDRRAERLRLGTAPAPEALVIEHLRERHNAVVHEVDDLDFTVRRLVGAGAGETTRAAVKRCANDANAASETLKRVRELLGIEAGADTVEGVKQFLGAVERNT